MTGREHGETGCLWNRSNS